MDRPSAPALHPARLPPGTQVGPWRVEGWAGCGIYGAVYRAVPDATEHATPVALKLALHPGDPRFAREGVLLSRVHHPSVPGLVAHGDWQHPGGPLYPFVAMEWVDGVPLYDQARLHPASCQQVLHWLAQLASALAALHAQGLVHRDVKGANILVRRADGRAVLTDFGTGIYPGAATLTPPLWFPGTPAYRSPESWLFELQFYREPTARYHAGPADDLYALGVTACTLLTGAYPEPGEPTQDEHGTWHLEAVIAPPALLNNPRVEPRLRALVLRMLSVRPEERGTATALAEALELAAEHTAPQSAEPCFTGQALPPSALPPEEAAAAPEPGALKHLGDDGVEVRAARPQELAPPIEAQEPLPEESSVATSFAGRVRLRAPTWPEWASLVLASASLALAVWTWWTAPQGPLEVPSVAQAEAAGGEAPDAGTVGLGEAAATTPLEEASSPPTQDGVTESTLPEPLPGQLRPDEKGRCPPKGLVALNGGCWVETALDREKCSDHGGQMFKGTCYEPFIPRGRRPNSSSMDKR
ncbi:serine/threonine-protein kinase [Hyalangium sp.]|uniref:serine/threonine-protein kinase n=1 Tax=Hyalangium sp. TaxID=2028555 RepID=UPI002D4341C6|nr:serine/threonine-protein kinase [Hyalangium sp.]HYI02816.1 serine/threonine-protein kinase [Hyalangium sp.]